jgi:hypothetical protein
MNFSAPPARPPARPPAYLPRPGKAGVGAVRSAPLMCHSHMHKRSLGKGLYSQCMDANTSCKATTCQHISYHHRLSTAAFVPVQAGTPRSMLSNLLRVRAIGECALLELPPVQEITACRIQLATKVNTSTGYASGFIPSSTGEQLARARNGREIAGRMLVTAYTVSSGCDYTPTLNSR